MAWVVHINIESRKLRVPLSPFETPNTFQKMSVFQDAAAMDVRPGQVGVAVVLSNKGQNKRAYFETTPASSKDVQYC